jgi:Rod binding domain-containing protein
MAQLSPQSRPQTAALRQKAVALEAAFLAEMLAHAGLDPTGDPLAGAGFSGGTGEAQFASFLRQEQARLMAERGGIGLAEALFAAMTGGKS